MKSSVLYRPIQVNKAYEKIVALSTDEINTDCLANGSLLYLMDTDKYMIWDEENKKFLEYVQSSGEGQGGTVGYTGYPTALRVSGNSKIYKFQDGVDAESYLKTFLPYFLGYKNQDGSTYIESLIYPFGNPKVGTRYTTYYAIAVRGSTASNVSLDFNEDKTITLASERGELWLPGTSSDRQEPYVLIAPKGGASNSWEAISTLPSLTASSLFDNEMMQQLVTVMKQLAAATPNTAVTKYIQLDEDMQSVALQIIYWLRVQMITRSRTTATILNNTTSLALHTNDSEDAPFASIKHQEVDFDGNKVYDFTFIFGKTKIFIQCTCYIADVLPIG